MGCSQNLGVNWILTAIIGKLQKIPIMYAYLITIILLSFSNIFMTFAWYGHLRNLSTKPWIIAALLSWGVALFEYLLQVPANRIGYQVMNLGQLKILQEIIALTIFVPFAVLYMKQKVTWDYLWAGFCIAGAAYFIFRQN
ncbi:Membrane protein [Gammaproteobacteria bacterium]